MTLEKLSNIQFLLFSLLILALSPDQAAQAKSPSPADIDAVLIISASLGEGTPGKQDGAILITRTDEITRYKTLFLNNHRFLHACGYTYDIELWAGDQLYETVPYNMECGLEEFERDTDRITALMQTNDRQFRAGAVATIHRFKVPVAQDPVVLIQTMHRDGLQVFPLGGLNGRYPSFDLSFTYTGKDSEAFHDNAQTQSQQFLAHWPKNLPQPLGYTPPEHRDSSYSNGLAETTLRSTVWFELGTDLTAIAAAIKTDQIKADKLVTPAFYTLTLIHPEQDREKIRTLLKPYPAVGLP